MAAGAMLVIANALFCNRLREQPGRGLGTVPALEEGRRNGPKHPGGNEMSKRTRIMRMAKRAGLTFLALEGLQAAAVAGAGRWAGRKLRDRGRNKALRLTGHALIGAASLVPVAGMMRRRFS
jgi:hypothetical protein